MTKKTAGTRVTLIKDCPLYTVLKKKGTVLDVDRERYKQLLREGYIKEPVATKVKKLLTK